MNADRIPSVQQRCWVLVGKRPSGKFKDRSKPFLLLRYSASPDLASLMLVPSAIIERNQTTEGHWLLHSSLSCPLVSVTRLCAQLPAVHWHAGLSLAFLS